MAEVIDRPLLKLAEAFDDLAARVNSQSEDLELGPLSHGLSLMLPLLRSFGFSFKIAFKIAEMDIVPKVNGLIETSKSVSSVKLMIENDIAKGCVRKPNSHSRNLLRLIRALDFIRLFFQNLLSEVSQKSLVKPATAAYKEVLGHFHGAVLKKIAIEGMRTLPRISKFYKNLKEDEVSARVLLQNYIRSSLVVIRYVEELFISGNLGIDW